MSNFMVFSFSKTRCQNSLAVTKKNYYENITKTTLMNENTRTEGEERGYKYMWKS